MAKETTVVRKPHQHLDLRKLRRKANLSQEDLARLIGTSWVTISRWERKEAKPGSEAGARLRRLQELMDRMGDALPPAGLSRFLLTPHPLLRGYKPADLLQSDYSFENLVDFVESAKSGDMA